MKKIFAMLLGIVFLAAGSPAFAQATRTWVSGVGDDANPCSRTAPCKTFAGAISKTATTGEINCLDSAGFGGVTITKSITIDCHSEHGGILSLNVTGVIINGASAVVTLRGLVINGAGGTTGSGVRILNAAAVNVDDCIIENFGGTGTQGRGVSIETAVANERVSVTNSQFYNNNNVSIHSTPTGGNVFLVVEDTTVGRSAGNGIQLTSQTTGTVNRTSISGTNAAVATELSTVALMVSNSDLSNNAIGVFNGNAGGAPTTRLFATVITGNTSQGLLNNAGSIISSGNNVIRGNAGNEVPTSTITTQ
jgi:hypothetical protein